MTGLPKLVQRAPTILYVAALLYFVVSILLAHLQIAMTYGETRPVLDEVGRITVLQAWIGAFEVALYIAANGVLAHILLAIWRKLPDRTGHGVDE